MKVCPTCNQQYSDDNLNFCLNDGAFLSSVSPKSARTMVLETPRQTDQTQWNQATGQPPTWPNPTQIQSPNAGVPFKIESPSQTLATISLVLGVVGILTLCCYGGLPIGAGAIITGAIALNQERNDPSKFGGRGLAIGGIVTGAICVLLTLGLFLLVIIS